MKTKALTLIKAVTVSLALYTCLTSLQAVAQSSKRLGPGDSGGGGSGLNGRVYEAYRFNPLETKAFKMHLKPTFDRLDQEAMQEYLKEKAQHEATSTEPFKKTQPFPSSDLFHLRNWYLIPDELESIASQSLGVEILTQKSETYAFQNFRELWISQSHFKRKSREDQAKLLLHELMVTLYLIKYQPMVDVIRMFELARLKSNPTVNSIDPDTNKLSLEELEKYTPWSEAPVEFNGLTKADYASIRDATFWFWSHRDRLTSKDFVRVLRLNNFDKRFFKEDVTEESSPSGQVEEPVKIETTGSEIFQKVQDGILTQNLNQNCLDKNLKEIPGCRASFFPDQIVLHQENREFVTIDLKANNSIRSNLSSQFPQVMNMERISDYTIANPTQARVGGIKWLAFADVEVVKSPPGAKLGRLTAITLQAYVITRKENNMCYGKPMTQINGQRARVLFLANNLNPKIAEMTIASELAIGQIFSDYEYPFYCPSN